MQQLFYFILIVFRQPVSQYPSRAVDRSSACAPTYNPTIRMKEPNFSIFNPRNDLLHTSNFYREPNLIEVPYILPSHLKFRTYTPKSFVPPLYALDIVCQLPVERKKLRNTYSIIVVTCKEVGSPFLTNSR